MNIEIKVLNLELCNEYRLYINESFISNAYLDIGYIDYENMKDDNDKRDPMATIKRLITNNIDFFMKSSVDEFMSIRNFFYGYAKIDIAELVFEKL